MATAIEYPAPVVMLRSARHGGLGIARSLGRMGIPVYSVDNDELAPVHTSRYCRNHYLLDVESAPSERGVEELLAVGRKLGGKPILIPTTDTAAIWVADHAEALRPVFRFPRQEAALVRTLCDKGTMRELARENGVPVACQVVPRSKEDVLQFLDSATFPVMIKATDAVRLRRRTGGTKFLTQTRAELLEIYARAAEHGDPNLLIQEFIPGEDWMFNGYFDRNSDYLFGATGKKIRRFPVKTGVTSLGICLRNETVERTTVDFMRGIGYQGILDIGYRRDSRDGKYKVLDVNPRIGCTFRLFAAPGGMDVARALYLNLTGRPVPASVVEEGRKWIVEDFDLISAMRSIRDRELSWKQWAESLRGIGEAACFALDDPMPLLMMGLSDWRDWRRSRRLRANLRKQDPPGGLRDAARLCDVRVPSDL